MILTETQSKNMENLADILRDGASADIWYDYTTFGEYADSNYEEKVENTKNAVYAVANILETLADELLAR